MEKHVARRKLVYEGKAKILYEGPEPGTLVQYFKDDATAFNAEKKDVIDGKQSVVWHEAENRLHAQKALLLHLIKA